MLSSDLNSSLRPLMALCCCAALFLAGCQPGPEPSPAPAAATATPAPTAPVATPILPTPTPEPPAPTAASPVEEEAATLLDQFLADTGVALVDESAAGGFTGLDVLQVRGDQPSLWAVHTVGMRSFASDPPPPHLLGIYAHTGASWRQLALQPIGDEPDQPSPDYLAAGAVRQVTVSADHVWLEVQGGAGAHSGIYHLFSFDGETLRQEVANFSASPGAGEVRDLDGDGAGEVLLDASDYYVFCYACAVRYIDYRVLRWDGQRLVAVEMAPLAEAGAPAELRELNDRAVELALAGLYAAALALLPQLTALDWPDEDRTVTWNVALIRLVGNSRRVQAQRVAVYPILDRAFYGDYTGAVRPFRDHAPADIFAQPSILVAGTVAEGWETALYDWVFGVTAPALQVDTQAETLAAVHFLRAWAAFVADPAHPDVAPNLVLAVELAPEDALFAASLNHLQ